MMMPATLSIIRLTFTDERERAVAIGIWASVASALLVGLGVPDQRAGGGGRLRGHAAAGAGRPARYLAPMGSGVVGAGAGCAVRVGAGDQVADRHAAVVRARCRRAAAGGHQRCGVRAAPAAAAVPAAGLRDLPQSRVPGRHAVGGVHPVRDGRPAAGHHPALPAGGGLHPVAGGPAGLGGGAGQPAQRVAGRQHPAPGRPASADLRWPGRRRGGCRRGCVRLPARPGLGGGRHGHHRLWHGLGHLGGVHRHPQ
ncbi:hypothetical protein G6F50_013965 [Rhizopus delemar]|uniref:Uncharacterized protein n=1 Tax=Rhizopus delemar TaxID=936053 RepID=A0A9P7CA36_9FUNG|nr:hypothetical protein G6F50_013965 [Rhizopus delemar]